MKRKKYLKDLKKKGSIMGNGEMTAISDFSYKKALEYLYNSIPMYQREGHTAYKPGLDNTIYLLDQLGNPQLKFKSIHIAGTNGKGSVSHMLCSVLMEAGYKTGLYTSPHLLDFRERIRINGNTIRKKFVTSFVKRIMPVCEKIKPSFFEITVAMAFDYFATQKTDIAVIETGMGGRLDSTNVLLPLVSVITNIGMDHTQYLGNKRKDIAGEKAGIIKNKIPVVIGESHPETIPVFTKKAKEMKTSLVFADQVYEIGTIKVLGNKQFFQIKKGGKIIKNKLVSDMTGIYQLKNLATVYTVIDEFKKQGIKIKKKAITGGLKKVKEKTGLMGRWDVIHKKPLVIFDNAHNAHGFDQLNKQLEELKYNKLFIVFGTVNDKDLSILMPSLPKKAFYFFTQAPIARAMDKMELYKIAHQHLLKGVTCASVKIACLNAFDMAKEEDLVLVTGSNFIVAEALKKVHFRK